MSDSPVIAGYGGIDERFLPRAYRLSGGASVGVVGVLAGLGWKAPALNFGIGAGLSVMAVLSLDYLVRRYVVPSERPDRHRRVLPVLALAKFPVIMGIFYGLVRTSWFHPVWLTVGLGVMPGVIIVQACTIAIIVSRRERATMPYRDMRTTNPGH